jgi:hypothetical protein
MAAATARKYSPAIVASFKEIIIKTLCLEECPAEQRRIRGHFAKLDDRETTKLIDRLLDELKTTAANGKSVSD